MQTGPSSDSAGAARIKAAEHRDAPGGHRRRSGRCSHWSAGDGGREWGGARTRGGEAHPRLTLRMSTCGQKRGSGAETGGGRRLSAASRPGKTLNSLALRALPGRAPHEGPLLQLRCRLVANRRVGGTEPKTDTVLSSGN